MLTDTPLAEVTTSPTADLRDTQPADLGQHPFVRRSHTPQKHNSPILSLLYMVTS